MFISSDPLALCERSKGSGASFVIRPADHPVAGVCIEGQFCSFIIEDGDGSGDSTVFNFARQGTVFRLFGIHCGVDHIACNRAYFRCPACKGIGVVAVACLCGSAAVIAGCGVVLHVLIGFQHSTVFVLPHNGVLVDRLGIGCGIGCRASNRRNSRRPSGKAVTELGIAGLDGRSTIVAGHRVVEHTFIQFKERSVLILPTDGIRAKFGSIGGRIGHIAFNRFNLRRPALENEFMLICGSLGGCYTVVGRHCAVFHARVCLKDSAVLIFPCDGVLVLDCGIYRSVCGIAGYGHHIGSPVTEAVAVLSCSCLTGGCMAGHIAIGHCGGVNKAAVIIEPCDSVLIFLRGICGFICGIAGHVCHSGSPAAEAVGILGGGCFAGVCRLADVRRLGAVVILGSRFQHGAVLVHKGNGVLVEGFAVLCRVSNVTGHGGDCGRPACKAIGILGISCLAGCAAVICGCSAVFHQPVSFQNCAVFILPRYGVGVALVNDVNCGSITSLNGAAYGAGLVGITGDRGFVDGIADTRIDAGDDNIFVSLQGECAALAGKCTGV